jgi:exopolyphosphatase/guanosine-5'-triphosphate,3'-diphosphate pyrophosphatase
VGTRSSGSRRAAKEANRAAVLDVGCFSAHLVVVERQLSREVLSRKVRLRLDESTDADGRITKRGIKRIVHAVRAVEGQLRTAHPGAFFAFATSSIRDATNADEVLEAVVRNTDVTLRVLSGRTEAHLAYRAARHWYGPTGPLAVLDVGGGTIEIAYGDVLRPSFACSLPLGARTLTRAGLTDDTQLAEVRDRLRRQIKHAVPSDVRRAIAKAPTVGCSKVFQSLAKLTGAVPLTADEVSVWIPRLAALPPRRRAELRGISPHRARQAFAGAVVAEALMTATGHSTIDICPWSTKEGVLLSLLEDQRRSITRAG